MQFETYLHVSQATYVLQMLCKCEPLCFYGFRHFFGTKSVCHLNKIRNKIKTRFYFNCKNTRAIFRSWQINEIRLKK